MGERINPGATVQLVDAHGVPLAEVPVRHAVRDGESITVTLDVVTTRAAEDALLAGILRRILDDRTHSHWVLDLGHFLFRGDLPLTTREAAWLNQHRRQQQDPA